MAVVATTGSASIDAADDETSGVPRPTTVAVKRISRDRRPTRTSSAVTSSTSPARTGARNCTSAYDANRPSSPSLRMQSSVATSPNRPSE